MATELEFRGIIKQNLEKLKAFEQFYYDSTELLTNYISIEDQNDIGKGIALIQRALEHTKQASTERSIENGMNGLFDE